MDENTALDEIQYIKKIISDSKTTLISNGKAYIFWGVLVVAGLLINYLILLFHIKFNYGKIWLLLIAIGWIYSFYSNRMRRREEKVKTFPGKILSAVWISIGIGMTLLGFIGPSSGAVRPVFISPILSVLLGVAFLITGYIHDEKWIKWLSLGWWIGAVYMFYFPGVQTILIMALMMLLLQVVPGIYFYRKYKQEAEVVS